MNEVRICEGLLYLYSQRIQPPLHRQEMESSLPYMRQVQPPLHRQEMESSPPTYIGRSSLPYMRQEMECVCSSLCIVKFSMASLTSSLVGSCP